MRGPLNTTLINGYMNHDLQLLVYQTSNLGQMSPLASVEYMYRKYDILSIGKFTLNIHFFLISIGKHSLVMLFTGAYVCCIS